MSDLFVETLNVDKYYWYGSLDNIYEIGNNNCQF